MCVATLGERLLGEVKEEGLDEILRSIHDDFNSNKPTLGIKPLDNIINVFQNPSPTRQQEIYREQEHTDARAPHPQAAKPPLVLEITGSTTCSGKTQLLCYIICLALLPSSFRQVPLNGRGEAVVLLDLSGRLSILRLRDIMHHIIVTRTQNAAVPLDDEETNSLIKASLLHLHIFKPDSTPSLLATLASIRSYLLARPPTHSSSHRRLGLIAITNLSTFLYQDRFDSETASFESAARQSGAANELLHSRYRTFVAHLREIHNIFSPTIIATDWALAPPSSMMGYPAIRPHLPAAWTNFVTLRLVVERERVVKFAPGLSIEEAESEREERREAVSKSRFLGWINWWGADGWNEGVREGLKGSESGPRGMFGFVIDGRGLEIDHAG